MSSEIKTGRLTKPRNTAFIGPGMAELLKF